MGKKRRKGNRGTAVVLTEEEWKEHEKKMAREREKYERDKKCGGVEGMGYVRLHTRGGW